jgi:hypothetical protein
MGKEDELKWEKEKERESELKGEIAEKYTLAVAKKKGDPGRGDRPSYDYFYIEERERESVKGLGRAPTREEMGLLSYHFAATCYRIF